MALNSIVEVVPNVMVGALVELMAVAVVPENPAGLDVINVPFMVAVAVVPMAMMPVPAFRVELAATVKVLELARLMLKSPVENKLPVLTFPTEIFPVTLVAVIVPLKVAPDELVLLMYKFRYAPAEKKLIVWGLESA